MPTYEWDSNHSAFAKECVSCNEVFVGTKDQQESERIFRKNFGVGGASNSDGLYTSCNLCRSGKTYGYRITHKEKRELYQKQNGKCGICLGELTYEEARIDHCHTTGIIRGLLHTPCNSQLGFYEKYKGNIEKYVNGIIR